jgi:hypothetical protein
MALKPGDRVTLTLNPTIWLTRFVSIKPFVSVSREIGDDPVADLADLEAEVQVQFKRALAREIEVLDDTTTALGESNSLDDLASWCQKELGNGVSARPSREVRSGDSGASEDGQAAVPSRPVRRPVARAKPGT